jgi:hypothetical protein
MLINRIREKSNDKNPPSSLVSHTKFPKNTQRPQSAGLKYLNKVASQQYRYTNNQDLPMENLENKDPLINVQRQP